MAHFLSLDRYERTRVLGKPWAMVTVELVAKKRLQVQADSLRVAKADVEWHPLPAGFEVVGGEGESIKPSPDRQFLVTVETFSPFHGLCEADPWP